MNLENKRSLSKVQHRKLVDEVLEQLKSYLLSGKYKVDDKIPTEPQLMEVLGIGRSTLREVIKILVYAGVLEVRQGDGTYIRSLHLSSSNFEQRLNEATIEDIYEVRRMLDLEVVKLAVQRRSNEDLLKMKEYLDKRNQALQLGNYSEYIDSDIQFHLSIAKASKNDVLYELYQTITPKLQTILSGLILKTNNYNDNTNIHVQLFNSILNQNAKEAEKYAIDNLELK
ncbi:FadR/GntR family transcriptional regulator [Neobacillus muris]|uniref:FadR/GntR family transcriptional regulator n=1 Tax=Neobacillus muris TaxID=2941334 RepID=UPI00203F92F1|nr:FadR/GntR family transcriptional regulator [Neobacillus muris]